METPTIKLPKMGDPQPDPLVLSPPRRTVFLLVVVAQSILAQGFRHTPPRFLSLMSHFDYHQEHHGYNRIQWKNPIIWTSDTLPLKDSQR